MYPRSSSCCSVALCGLPNSDVWSASRVPNACRDRRLSQKFAGQTLWSQSVKPSTTPPHRDFSRLVEPAMNRLRDQRRGRRGHAGDTVGTYTSSGTTPPPNSSTPASTSERLRDASDMGAAVPPHSACTRPGFLRQTSERRQRWPDACRPADPPLLWNLVRIEPTGANKNSLAPTQRLPVTFVEPSALGF
jgi:hypothetical protein